MDPESGRMYNIKEFPPTDEAVLKRLIELPEDNEAILRARITHWNNNLYLIEEEFGDQITTIPADQSVQEVTKTIAEVILPAHLLAGAR
jgi:adenylate kinase